MTDYKLGFFTTPFINHKYALHRYTYIDVGGVKSHEIGIISYGMHNSKVLFVFNFVSPTCMIAMCITIPLSYR